MWKVFTYLIDSRNEIVYRNMTWFLKVIQKYMPGIFGQGSSSITTFEYELFSGIAEFGQV